MNTHLKPLHPQKGATLAVTLILLFIITLLGVSAIHVTQMQERMASSLQDKELSFQAAETGLAAGEAWILNLNTQPPVTTTCSPFPCVQTAHQNVIFDEQSSTWWSANSATYTGNLASVASQPQYIIEFLEVVSDDPSIGSSSQKSRHTFYYQITARGTGSSDSTVSVLQTTVGRRF